MVAKNERAPIEPFAAAAPEAPGPTVSTRFEEAALRLEDGNFDWLLSRWRRSLRVDALNLAQPTSGRSPGVSFMRGDREVRFGTRMFI
jgi:hypothetical protein